MAEGPGFGQARDAKNPYNLLSESDDWTRHVEDMAFLIRYIFDRQLSTREAMLALGAPLAEVEAVRGGQMKFVGFDRSREMRDRVQKHEADLQAANQMRVPDSKAGDMLRARSIKHPSKLPKKPGA